ncbi:hypothetical protein DL96DRAFT_809282 [Flagelloscypha sp. PMI_526]|nr:hypothetical protein DL96DRAFT_809282 [Flagelloscypha sp. PMI_526]
MARVRLHTKSRTGCLTCKGRKVKCDEESYPICKNCEKRGVACEWATPASSSNELGSSSKSPSNALQTISPPLDVLPSPPHPFDRITLELFLHLTTEMRIGLVGRLHNWSSNSYMAVHQAYERMVPKLALKHPFLMHTLLSLSSLHLHITSQDKLGPRDHYSLALYHFRHAVADKSEICKDGQCSSLDHPCTQLATAQFISYAILSVISLCEISTSMFGKKPEFQLDKWIGWIQSRRNLIHDFFRDHRAKLFHGPLATLIRLSTEYVDEARTSAPPQPPPTHISGLPVFPTILTAIHIPFEGCIDPSELYEQGAAEAYRSAVETLRFAYDLFARGGYSPAFDAWLSTIPGSYMRLLHQQKPRALVILANFWALFKKFMSMPENTVWWEPFIAQTNGQSDWIQVIREVLEPDWKAYLDVCLSWDNQLLEDVLMNEGDANLTENWMSQAVVE